MKIKVFIFLVIIVLLSAFVSCASPVEPSSTEKHQTDGTTEEQTTEESTAELTEEIKDETTVREKPLAADEPFLNLWREIYPLAVSDSLEGEHWGSILHNCLMNGDSRKPLIFYDSEAKKAIFPLVEGDAYLPAIKRPSMAGAQSPTGAFANENPADYLAIQEGKVYLPLKFANFLEEYRDMLNENVLIPCIVYSDSAFMPSKTYEEQAARREAFTTQEYELLKKVLEENGILYLPLEYYDEAFAHARHAVSMYVFLTVEEIYAMQSSVDIPIIITYSYDIFVEAYSPMP